MNEVQEEFQETVNLHRRHHRTAGLFLVIMALIGVFAIPSGLFTADVGRGFIIFFMVACVLLLLCVPPLLCPKCQQVCHYPIDQFCCVCQGNSIDRTKRSWTREILPQCRKCLAVLEHFLKTNRPSFKIRYCTHCGELLDPKGKYPRGLLGGGNFKVK